MTIANLAAERRRVVSRRVGSAHNGAKTHCPAGHAYAGSNVALRLRQRDGLAWVERRCAECRRKQR